MVFKKRTIANVFIADFAFLLRRWRASWRSAHGAWTNGRRILARSGRRLIRTPLRWKRVWHHGALCVKRHESQHMLVGRCSVATRLEMAGNGKEVLGSCGLRLPFFAFERSNPQYYRASEKLRIHACGGQH